MSRRDPTPNFYWVGTGPGGGLAPTNFLARWTGTLTAPTTGSYKFHVVNDDGIRIWVNNTLVMDRWFDQSNGAGVDTSAFNLTQDQGVDLKVEYYQGGGDAFVGLWAIGPFGEGGAPAAAALPPSWLSPGTAPLSPGRTEPLPSGWTLAPGKLSYASAQVTDRSVTFVDTSGAAHTYQWEAGAFRPPPEQDGVVGMARSGALTLQADDGLTYAFETDGRIHSASAPTDDAATSAAGYTFTPPPGPATEPYRLTTITDPAGGRTITLRYDEHTEACNGTTPAGFDSAPPPEMLCQVDYWDGTHTYLWYESGQLARIEDPGGAVTDFGYDAEGRLTKVRSPWWPTPSPPVSRPTTTPPARWWST